MSGKRFFAQGDTESGTSDCKAALLIRLQRIRVKHVPPIEHFDGHAVRQGRQKMCGLMRKGMRADFAAEGMKQPRRFEKA